MASEQTSLYRAILTCRTEAELRAFIADLLSTPEIDRALLRWEIAQTCIKDDCSQRGAERQHNASQDLVKRVYAAVRHRGSGYLLAYKRLFGKAALPKTDAKTPKRRLKSPR